MVPMQIKIPMWTGEQSANGDSKPTYRRVPSVREQIYRSYSVEQVKMSQDAQISGLFPASTPGRWPALACTCCYDPFSEERARDQLRQLHRYRYGKTSTSHSKLMYNSLLPWNVSFQVLSFTNNFALAHSDQHPPSSIQDRSNTTHKLPRRYQRAASSAAQSGRTPRNQPSPQKTRRRTSKENLVNDCNGVQQDHARRVSAGGRSDISESEIRIEGELLGPCFFGLQETGFRRQQQRLSAVTTPVLKRSTVSHAYTMHDIRSIPNNFPNSPSITQSSLFSVPYRSCTGLYGSNSNIFDLLGAAKIDFTRLPSPEAVVIRLKARNRASTLESDTSFEEGVAIRLFSTSSPVENTPTGYQHLRLRFGQPFPSDSSSEDHRSRHEVCHSQLCNTVGLWIFCKIDLAIHAPISLGELVDTVSQELSSRCNSLTRKYYCTEQGQSNDGFTSSLRNVQMPSADLVQSAIEMEM
ncbi:hypothetical protein T265_09305 [Opisthorchis viverrini]|uniref:Uncharacterized protein n=1 Tax=Opisthorchis viverrini TaxID=6198 RepID=A0A074ZAP9_OPIVI|nr:hypothetical protein T265_09305 [Opisthorchis viverrini]KER22642.1 hypothetical protein T265_09305 [Opisthorchis viverrini]